MEVFSLMAEVPSFLESPDSIAQTFLNADGTGEKTLLTTSTRTGITAAWVVTDEEATAFDVLFWLELGSGQKIRRAAVPVTLSTGKRVETNLLDVVYWKGLNPLNRLILVPSSTLIKVSLSAILTSGKFADVCIEYGVYT